MALFRLKEPGYRRHSDSTDSDQVPGGIILGKKALAEGRRMLIARGGGVRW